MYYNIYCSLLAVLFLIGAWLGLGETQGATGAFSLFGSCVFVSFVITLVIGHIRNWE